MIIFIHVDKNVPFSPYFGHLCPPDCNCLPIYLSLLYASADIIALNSVP